MVLLLAVLAGLTVSLMSVALFPPRRAVSRDRIEELYDPGPQELYARPFSQRVLGALMMRVLAAVRSFLPASVVGSIADRLEVAGRPMSVNRFMAIELIAGLAAPVGLLLLVGALGGSVSGPFLAVVLGMSVFGLFLPWFLLGRSAGRRSRSIYRALPDAIDMIVTNVEVGVGLQAALLSVAERFGGPIAEGFQRAVREVSLGRSQEEALMGMAKRSGVPDMRLFASAIVQAHRTGIPIAKVLRNYSVEMRERRRQHAREQANKIPVKMTLPTVGFIFPTLFLLLLGPVALSVLEQFSRR